MAGRRRRVCEAAAPVGCGPQSAICALGRLPSEAWRNSKPTPSHRRQSWLTNSGRSASQGSPQQMARAVGHRSATGAEASRAGSSGECRYKLGRLGDGPRCRGTLNGRPCALVPNLSTAFTPKRRPRRDTTVNNFGELPTMTTSLRYNPCSARGSPPASRADVTFSSRE
jgi:hypothetical protein